MCTIVILNNIGNYKYIIAANRDERDNRPSEGWCDWDSGKSDYINIFAPKDVISGGSWIGINGFNRLAALTDSDDFPHQKGKKSKGQLLVDVLKCGNPTALLSNINPKEYNGFNLVFEDMGKLFLAVNYISSIKIYDVDIGLTVITGYGTTKRHCKRAKLIEDRYNEINQNNIVMGKSNIMVSDVNRLINFHDDGNPEHACCVHNHATHNTVSSSVIFAGYDKTEIFERTGRACEKGFEKKHILKFRADHYSAINLAMT